MKFLFSALFLVNLSIVLSYPTNDEIRRWNLLRDGNGKMHMFDMNPIELEHEPEPSFDPINDMFFLLFTRSNPTVGQRITINDAASLQSSNWRPQSETRFLIHGWQSSSASGENPRTRDAFLSLADHNVVVVDWSVGAGAANYITARNRVGQAGAIVGQFIDWVTSLGYARPERTNIVGISLGAHVSGHAGKNTQSGVINAIFGNDPAGPLFTVENPDRLDAGDAFYTEACITNAGQLGLGPPIVHATFYPNWGSSQPNCGADVTGSCAHARSTFLYSESVNSNRFVSRQCASYDEILAQNCPGTGVIATMGGDLAKNLRGVFFLETNGQSPFAMG